MDPRLQAALERKNLVFVVGTGFSAATTGGERVATWRGLIEDGIDRAESLDPRPGWATQVRGNLEYGFKQNDMDMILGAASSVVKELRRNGPYVFPKWLQETVGSLDTAHPELGKRLRALPYPLLTTNYDSLLENNDRRGTDWTRPTEMQRLLAGTDSRDIGHLHGIWSNPDSVVLAERQYDELMASEAAQALEKAASTLKSLVYVGFGSGLDDPNFGHLIAWHRDRFIPSAVDHFRLCRTSELPELRAQHANDQIFPVAYGDDYDELPEFLKQFARQESIELSKAGIARDVVGEAQVSFAEEMKQDSILGDALDGAFDRPVSDLIVPPVLLPVPHAEFLKARSSKDEKKIDRLDPKDEITRGDILVVAAEENTGLTMTIKWLALEASKHFVGASPIYIPFSSCRKLQEPLGDAIRREAHKRQLVQHRNDALPPYVLAIDNLSPFVDGLSEKTLGEIASSRALLTIVGCVQGVEDEIVERLERLGSRPRVRYVGKLSAADVREYARLASPSNYEKLADQVLLMLQAENLAKTPFTVSLLISVLLQGGKFAANASQTSILDDYIGLLLGRGDPHEDARFGLDQTAREALLSGLAETFVRAGVGGMSEIDVQASFKATFDKFGWDESTSEVLNSFVDRRVLRRKGNHVEFSRSSFLHIFAAKRATTDASFRNHLLGRPLYYSAAITDYAALFRHDADLLRRLSKLLEPSNEPRQRLGVFEPLALAEPRLSPHEPNQMKAIEGRDPDSAGTDLERTADSDWKDAVFDSADDADLPPFPTVDEHDVPQALRLLRTLELVSTVLRDSDQVEDLQLKRDVLHEVLDQWASAMDIIREDPTFYDLVKSLVTELELAKKDGSDADDVLNEFSRAIPAAIVMNSVGTSLASRKLTRILDKLVADPDEPASEELVIIACFFQYSLAERGWPKRVSNLLRGRDNIWIIRNFLLHLLTYTYVQDDVDPADSPDLLELCALIIQQASRYKDQPEQRRHYTTITEDLNAERLRRRVRRRYAMDGLTSGMGS